MYRLLVDLSLSREWLDMLLSEDKAIVIHDVLLCFYFFYYKYIIFRKVEVLQV